MTQDTEICKCGHDYDTHKRPGDRKCRICVCSRFQMDTKVTQEQVSEFRKQCDPQYRDILSVSQITNMILCDRQRDEIRAANGTYYDYDLQRWVEPSASKVV